MMQIRHLVSLNRNLNSEFINHITNTNNLCLYKLGNHSIPQNIFFPKAHTLTLINCNSNGILNIFTPRVFPNLNTVNYISADPGDFKIYERFNDKIKWAFPNKAYEFYDFMVKNGRGVKDPDLIKKYITNKKIVDGKNGFDISFEFDLNIPEYGIVNGDWWRAQFYEYLVRQQNEYSKEYYSSISQEFEEANLEKELVAEQLFNCDFKNILDID